MKTFLISYDLIGQRDYPELIEAIKQYPFWAKPLESLWLIKTNETAAQVRDYLKSHIDDDDKLFVIDVTGTGWATYNISQRITDWMKSNL